jgi:hypothetical protein
MMRGCRPDEVRLSVFSFSKLASLELPATADHYMVGWRTSARPVSQCNTRLSRIQHATALFSENRRKIMVKAVTDNFFVSNNLKHFSVCVLALTVTSQVS